MSDAKLFYAAFALLALNVAHALDHVINQDQGVEAVGVIGGAGILVSLVALVLVIAGAKLAAPVLAVVGFGEAVAFLLIHVAPSWGPISDPYYDAANVNALSWVVLAVCVGVAAYAGWVGARDAEWPSLRKGY